MGYNKSSHAMPYRNNGFGFLIQYLAYTVGVKLDGNNDEVLAFIYKFASQRIPVSSYFGTDNSVDVLMFYCVHVFSQDIYYLDQERAIVIYKQEENELHLFDIISQSPIDIHDILVNISGKDTTKIVFHFTPDYQNISTEKNTFHGNEVLFMKVAEKEFNLMSNDNVNNVNRESINL
ncbi:hypothetical protein PP175_04080 [Aneurinibacillus sp. Ricciae_BoGa-3]|uniref:hypothetical protein n=1 Tax=Aneurinibacillus sp. Ricciae_BoGa-3 TaxID=3022697 RepID=UPI00233FD622|nr:hypothetical protein [Aneurinibacillus sp. Ricciae_BoGa-3]WCK55174.1 hypothetical protein PP175_04080 [Aneurinibacillus sp. Ricciae_BoGa-3]